MESLEKVDMEKARPDQKVPAVQAPSSVERLAIDRVSLRPHWRHSRAFRELLIIFSA